jgi:hypothetical protein
VAKHELIGVHVAKVPDGKHHVKQPAVRDGGMNPSLGNTDDQAGCRMVDA